MDVAILTVSSLSFMFVIVLTIWVMNVANSLRSQSMHNNNIKVQLTYLYERLGEISDKSDKLSESSRDELERLKNELSDLLKQGRNDTMRENDDIKFISKQIHEKLENKTKR